MYIELPALGADVSHAAPGSDRPSIAGMVSSVDENFSQYVASTRVQEARTELIAELDGMVEVKSCRDSCLIFGLILFSSTPLKISIRFGE